jgi:hypothetical protein
MKAILTQFGVRNFKPALRKALRISQEANNRDRERPAPSLAQSTWLEASTPRQRVRTSLVSSQRYVGGGPRRVWQHRPALPARPMSLSAA